LSQDIRVSAERQLDLLMEMDRLRDEARDPDELLTGIVRVMAGAFAADSCFLFVTDPSAGTQELKAVLDPSGTVGRLSPEELSLLSQRLFRVAAIEAWTGPEADQGSGFPTDAGHAAVVPIVMGGDDRVGTMFLSRSKEAFDEADLHLLHFAESQLDSALVQARRLYELDLRSRELETIYRVDRIRDANLGFDEMLDQVLQELRTVIPSDVAFIMLYDRAGRNLQLRATTGGDEADGWPGAGRVESAGTRAVQAGELIVENVTEPRAGSIMCVPLILREEILGVFGMARRGSERFKEGEQRLLQAIASQMDTAIFESLEKGRLRHVLGRTVDPRVLDRLLESSVEGILEGERQVLTVLYADLRGSTELAAKADPRDFVAFINDYLAEMAEIIVKHEGTLDKFMGDEVMALFGAPLPMEDHALRAVRAGLEMQQVHRTIMDRWIERGLDAPPLGIGIASGEMIVGEMGSGRRSDYTVLGAPANLGARIRGVSKPDQVLISAETYDMVRNQVEARPISGLRFKGIRGEVTVWDVGRPARDLRQQDTSRD